MTKNGKMRSRRNRSPASGATTTSKTKYKAPTSGLEEVVFTWGTARDAAKFEEVKSELSHHVGVQSWKYATEISKAMAELEEPAFIRPTRPVREYWSDFMQTIITQNKYTVTTTPRSEGPPVVEESTTSRANVPTKEEWELRIDTEDYLEANKAYKERKSAWEENRSKAYYLVL
jgi:hypothetical protein